MTGTHQENKSKKILVSLSFVFILRYIWSLSPQKLWFDCCQKIIEHNPTRIKHENNKLKQIKISKITLSGLPTKKRAQSTIYVPSNVKKTSAKSEQNWENLSEKCKSEAKSVLNLKDVDLQPLWHQRVEDGVDGGVEIVEHTCKQLSLIEL